MDKDKFLKFARRDPAGKLLLERLGTLDIRINETTLEQIEEWGIDKGIRLERADVVQAVRKMEKTGVIKFVVGRRGALSRIEWQIDTRNLVDEGILSPVEVEDEDAEEDKDDTVIEQEHSVMTTKISDITIEHSFRVRPQFPIVLRLPADLTLAEAERLAAFIKTLPFTEAN